MSFEKFKKAQSPKPIDIQAKNDLLASLLEEIRNVGSPDSVNPDYERAAGELMALCKDLLRRATPPNLVLLRACGVDTDSLLSALGAATQDHKLLLFIDTNLDDRIQIEVEKLTLSKRKAGIREIYMAGCLAKLTAILARPNVDADEKRNQAEDLLNSGMAFFAEIGDEEGERLVHLQFSRLPPKGVELYNNNDRDIVRAVCPCCGQVRSSKPFPDVARVAVISTPGKLPYEGVLFCPKCGQLRCGVKARWVESSVPEPELARLKREGSVPNNMRMYYAKCGLGSCKGDLCTLTRTVLEQWAKAYPSKTEHVMVTRKDELP